MKKRNKFLVSRIIRAMVNFEEGGKLRWSDVVATGRIVRL